MTSVLDQETAQRIGPLARNWGVSEAEAIRRSVERAALQDASAMTPAEVVAHYASQRLPRTKSETRRLIAAMRRLRRDEDAHGARGK